MKTILSLKRHYYVKKVSTFLIMVALIVGLVSCEHGCHGDPFGFFSLTMAANPPAGGTATDLTGGSPYLANALVSIQAVAAVNYQFVNWTASAGTFANATAATTTFTMPAQNVIVTANFFQGQLIRTWYDLDAVRNNLSDSYLLMNDLDSTTPGYTELASPTANGGKGWQPIGEKNVTITFIGIFDGQGYEISNLFIDRPDEDYVGLFRRVIGGGVVRNVGLVNVDVTGGNFTGGLVGGSSGTVSNSYSTGNVTGTGTSYYLFVGGLVGVSNGTVSNSYSTGNVNGTGGGQSSAFGGLVGVNFGTVSNSSAIGSVTGTGASNYTHVGGLVGYNSNGTVSKSYATGNVTGSGHSFVGGLVGFNVDDGTVSNSYATGNVSGTWDVGGLVGFNFESTVSDSYSTGSVSGNASVGGLVGVNTGTVANSFWDTETSGQNSSAGGTGKNTTEMQDITTFSGATWNITTVGGIGERNITYIWNIVNNVTYPFLSWQPVS